MPDSAAQLQARLQKFPRYTEYDTPVPVYCLTQDRGPVIHRFFDSSPISPSGRYLAVTRFPFEDRSPQPGDTAEVVLMDLETQAEIVVATTRGWGSQLGAQVQWGATDEELYFNDLDTKTWQPFGLQYNPSNGQTRRLEGTVYHVSPDGRLAVSPCLLRTGRTQLGYGVMAPDAAVPRNLHAPDDDGVYVTDLVTGKSHLHISIRDLVGGIAHLASPRYLNGDFYVFHTKWSPDGERIMIILRWTPAAPKRRWWQKAARPAPKSSMRKFVMTVSADGSDPRIAISDEAWAKGGHHPNWCPDSQHVMMNLNRDGEGLRFVRADIGGQELALLHPTAEGSGHPSLHPSGQWLLTDAYPGEAASYGDGTVPVRLINLECGDETLLARMQSRPAYVGDRKEMRVDAHPAWDVSGNFVVFNGCAGGTRGVYVADVGGVVAQAFTKR